MTEIPKIESESPADGGITANAWSWMQFLIGAIIVALFIGFVAAMIAVGVAWEASTAAKQATYEDLKDQVVAQNSKMDLIILQLQANRQIPQ
jgi:hypothetical protein